MNKPVITVSRQFASRGSDIAKLLSEKLGIKFYDKEILDLAAQESGLDMELIKEHDEAPPNSFLYALSLGAYNHNNLHYEYHDLHVSDKIFNLQAEIIRNAANEGPCVILGRCAEDILSEFPNVISVFIHADKETRAKQVSENENVDIKKAMSIIAKEDKRRTNYHNRFCDKNWGVAEAYDICLDSKIGIENCVDIIIKYIEGTN